MGLRNWNSKKVKLHNSFNFKLNCYFSGMSKNNHYAGLLELISENLRVPSKKIVDMDLSLVDVQ